MNTLSDLIGIPFKLGGIDFGGCDCRGICYLYHKHIHNHEIPNSDGKRIRFRNPKKDKERIGNFLIKFCNVIISLEEIKEGDFILLKAEKNVPAMGVCVKDGHILYMTKRYGSCMANIVLLKHLFVMGYRLKNEKI